MPLKSAGIVLLTQLIMSGLFILIGIPTWSVVISLMLCLLAVGYYIGVLYKDFWNIVLEESKGLLPDILMWMYYMALCAISLSPAFVLFYLSDMYI